MRPCWRLALAVGYFFMLLLNRKPSALIVFGNYARRRMA